MLKKVITVMLAVVLVFVIVGCGKEDLTGRWVYTDESITVILELFSDGTGTSDDGTVTWPITWLAENGRIKFDFDYGLLGSESHTYDYTLKKDSLIMMDEDGRPVEYKRNVDVSKLKAESSGAAYSQNTEAADEPIKYSCMDEIKNASPESGLVQIDDMIFQYGAVFSEIYSAIEKSECMYSAECNIHSAVPAGKSVGIRFYKDGEQYFIIHVVNRKKETIEIKDCDVYSISVLDEAMGSAYYAGFGDEEMTYTTVKEAMAGYEPEEELFGSDFRGNDELGIMYTFPFRQAEMHVYFIFDGITNELITFEIDEHKYDSVGWPW